MANKPAPPTIERSATYNAEFGHDRLPHAKMILSRFEHAQLDVLCLSEVRDYLHDLGPLVKAAGHRLLVINGRLGSNQVAILVRGGHEVGNVWGFVAGLSYLRVGGGKMAPSQCIAAEIDGQIIVAGHAPVQAWVTTPRGRKWIGAIRRRLAYRRFAIRLVKVFTRHPHKAVQAWLDANANPDTVGRWSPEWIRKQVGGEFARPHRSTGHGEIDFGIVRGVEVKSCTVEPNPRGLPHSDHLLVMAETVEIGA